MLWPTSRSDRKRWLTTWRQMYSTVKTQCAPQLTEDLKKESARRVRSVYPAGFIVMTQVQLSLNDQRPTLENAVRIARNHLPKLKAWDLIDKNHQHTPQSEGKLKTCLSANKSVAFLWAAFLYAEQNKQEDIFAQIPKLIAYSNEFERLYKDAYIQRSIKKNKTDKKEKWHVKLPKQMQIVEKLDTLSLPDEWFDQINQ